jgi:hypothetical protein
MSLTINPGIGGTDVDVSTPVPQTTPTSITGTPGTGGKITFGTYHGLPVPEPHRVWRFDIALPAIQGVAKPIVQSLEPGFDNISSEHHPIGGRHHFEAGFFDASELRLLFYGDENQTPLEYILAWKKLIRNYNADTGLDDGTYKYSDGHDGYFKDIVVTLQNMKNEDKYKITYKKCFPTVTAPLRLDYEPSARTVVAQSFAVNRIITVKVGSQSTTANPAAITPAGASFNLLAIPRLQL